MEITVFTPTYNRGYIIKNLYNSLLEQTFKDFEWIVIDDGSTDDTASLFEEIKSYETPFPITYERIENAGKHKAVNYGVRYASGRLFFIVDSDDSLPPDALETIIKYENSISKEQIDQFAGVAGLKGTNDVDYLGSTFGEEICDCTYRETKGQNISGDKAEVYYTDIIRKYPFPEFPNEKFIPESTAWNMIAADGYKLRYFNKVVYYCEYLSDGLTKQGNQKYRSIPKGYGLYLHQRIEFGQLNKLRKWETLLEYYNMFSDKMSIFEIAKNLQMNPFRLYFRLLGMRVFYKLYNK